MLVLSVITFGDFLITNLKMQCPNCENVLDYCNKTQPIQDGPPSLLDSSCDSSLRIIG